MGGEPRPGILSDDIWMVTVSGGTLIWEKQIDLPVPLAYFSVFHAGSLLYVVGGEDISGSRSEVWYTFLDGATGRLGFPLVPWVRSPRSLPHPLSRAGSAVKDGRFFLVGGVTITSGSDPVYRDEILQSRVWGDLQPGQWYQSPVRLPEGIASPGMAPGGDGFLLVGGRSAVGLRSDVVSLSWGEHGLITGVHTVISLPSALESPLVIPLEQGLYISGGRGDLRPLNQAWVLQSNFSDLRPEVSPHSGALGPGYLAAQGGAFHLPSEESEGTALSWTDLGGEVLFSPELWPGSGPVAGNQTLVVTPLTEGVLRWRLLGPEDPLPSALAPEDPVFSGLRVTTDTRAAFQYFPWDGVPGSLAEYRWTTVPGGLFVFISGLLGLKESLQTVEFSQGFSPEDRVHKALVWYRLSVPAGSFSAAELDLVDSTVSGSGFSAQVKLTLFEEDRRTWVVDAGGVPVQNYRAVDNLRRLRLGPGDYYLLLETETPLPAADQPPLTAGVVLRAEK